MKLCRALFSAGIITIFAGALPALAAEEPVHGAENPIRVEPVVVSATRTERVLRDVPSSIEIITNSQIRERPVQTVADALRDIPGVQVLDNTMAGLQKISIRGESGTRVLILIDGIKSTDQKSMDGATIMMDPNFIERIEVIKGPASVLYGSEAIGGAVNIITKKGGTKPIQATLMTSFDSSVDAFYPKGSVFGEVDGFGYRVIGTYIDANDRNGADGRINNTAYINRYGSAYLDYKWDKASIAGGYDFFENSSDPMVGDPAQGISMGMPKWQREKLYLTGEVKEISEYFAKLKMTAYRQEVIKNFWNDVNVKSGSVRVHTHPVTEGDITTYGGTLQSDWSLGSNNYLIAGIDGGKDWLRSSDYNTTTMTITTPMGDRVTRSGYDDRLKGDQGTIAAFIQDEWTFVPGWTVTGGLRQTWVKSALTDSDRYDTASSNDSHLVGSLGLVYSGFEDWRFRAQFGQGYRYPNLQQLYMGTSHGGAGTTYGNSALKPETSDNYEVGVRYNTKAWMADLAAYHSRAKDYIAAESINAVDRQFKNMDGARTSGVEGRLEYTITSLSLTPYVSGAYMYRTFDQDNGKTAETGDPRWSGSTGLRFEQELFPKFQFTADLYSRFASSAREYTNAGVRYEHSGWSTLNFNIGARYGEEMQYFANLAFNNLTNREYRTAKGSLDEPGFNVAAQLGMEF